jgi:hypothetical protein
MTLQKIEFGDEGQVATRELVARYEALAARDGRAADASLEECLRAMLRLDRQHGGNARLPVDDTEDLVAAALTALAHMELWARRDEGRAAAPDVAEITLGVALWAMRHEIRIPVVEPLANALAVRSNRAASPQELAAVFGLMQGVIAYVKPHLQADLERSNPERPWRVLHANFAITAIRTEDPVLMGHAFDALDEALPDERANFYAEALALALAPGVSPGVRESLEARHRRWNLR